LTLRIIAALLAGVAIFMAVDGYHRNVNDRVALESRAHAEMAKPVR
jgi:hypothetical protein